ncbi:unnamed protein product [Coffea canephora]|uniref:Uncharacterized protein n=1 Tax=Coffea canephora TaxID=49390 RepID=A0A068TR53_COFCA|nr:unnamed protein product [Coffea canephora]
MWHMTSALRIRTRDCRHLSRAFPVLTCACRRSRWFDHLQPHPTVVHHKASRNHVGYQVFGNGT